MNDSMVLDVSVIIPFKDKAFLTIACIETLVRYGDRCKEILLVSNNSSQDEIELVQNAIHHVPNAKLLVYNEPFNFQKINNWAANQASSKVLFLLNNDIELTPKSAGLLRVMYDRASQESVGAVGCILLYEDRRTIQHAGVYLVAGGMADHLYIGKHYERVMRTLHSGKSGWFDIRQDSDVSAVTAAAVMIQKAKFDKINGMNEDFIIGGGDVDLCLRLAENNYRTVLVGTENGYMIHKESKTRSALAIPYVDFVESYKSYSKHFDIKKGDPFMSIENIANGK